MDDDKSDVPEVFRPTRPQEGSATFGGALPRGNVSVHVKAENLNIHPSSLSALERIAEKNPEIASQLIKASEHAVDVDGRKYQTAAGGSMLVALTIIVGSAAVLITQGLLAGIVFFAACVAACAVVTALLTGKSQDISWTVKLLGGLGRQDSSSSPPPQD